MDCQDRNNFFAKITAADMDIQSKIKDGDRRVEGPVTRKIQLYNMCAKEIVNPQASPLMKEKSRFVVAWFLTVFTTAHVQWLPHWFYLLTI